jgi:hypothetical protein
VTPPPAISSRVTTASAIVLLAGGLAMLFAADAILPVLVPGFPAEGAWLGQLLGAAWLGVAMLDWMHRTTLIGGIYGRAIVMANLVLYFVGATSLVRPLLRAGAPAAMWLVFAPFALLALVYGVLLYRGPFDPLGA